MSISLRTTQQKNGGNHAGIIYRDSNGVELGVAVWDPVRLQFAFHPTPEDQPLTASDQAAIVTILNGLSP